MSGSFVHSCVSILDLFHCTIECMALRYMHTLGVWVSKCGRYPAAAAVCAGMESECVRVGVKPAVTSEHALPGPSRLWPFWEGKKSLEPVCSFKQFLMLSDGCCFHPRIQFCFVLNSGCWVSCRLWCKRLLSEGSCWMLLALPTFRTHSWLAHRVVGKTPPLQTQSWTPTCVDSRDCAWGPFLFS